MLKQKLKISGYPKVKPAFCKQQGFSLMEVLIAMIIIAIGLLGFLSLQLASINSNQEGLARTQATLIGQDLAASIRGNRKYINQGDGSANVGNLYTDSAYDNCTSEPIPNCSGSGANCTQEQQAGYDVWKTCATLNGFDGIGGDSTNNPLIEGAVFVACDDRDLGDGDSCSPGSTLNIYSYWRAGAMREDVGQSQTVIRNSRCANFAQDPGDAFDCTIIDIMP